MAEDVAIGVGAREPHAGHGPRRPVTAVPPRRPGSVRRTATTDMLRPDGLLGDIVLHGRARDLRTDGDGTAVVLDVTVLDAVIAAGPLRTVSRLSAVPSPPGLGGLVGAPAMSGFRAALRASVPEEVAAATPLALLLDDLPVAVLVSGYAVAALPPEGRPARHRPPPADVCSGWRRDGTMMTMIAAAGTLPVMVGPPAPDLDASADCRAGHTVPELPRGAMRRRRRMDVVRDGVLLVDVHYRDSYCAQSGHEQVVHEYVLRARISPDDLVVIDVAVEPRVLPWRECPSAVDSVERVVGRCAGELRRYVPEALTGIGTCTHLNDLVRTLDDVVPLARALP